MILKHTVTNLTWKESFISINMNKTMRTTIYITHTPHPLCVSCSLSNLTSCWNLWSHKHNVYVHWKNRKRSKKKSLLIAVLPGHKGTRAWGFILGDNTDSYWSWANHLTDDFVFKWTRLQIKGGKIYVLLSNILTEIRKPIDFIISGTVAAVISWTGSLKYGYRTRFHHGAADAPKQTFSLKQ